MTFTWIDEDLAEIQCPYCGEDVVINILVDTNKCKCGKCFKMVQIDKIVEVVDA